MSTSYYISPFDPISYSASAPQPQSSLQLDPAAYRVALRQRWPTASKWPSEHFAAGVHWCLDEYNLHGVEVHLHPDLQHVSISSAGINLIEFILWHRAYVSAVYPLYLFNVSDIAVFTLTPATTYAELFQFCGFADDVLMPASPFNGTWDGSFVLTDAPDGGLYLWTLHLYEYRDGMQAECLLWTRAMDVVVKWTLRGGRPGAAIAELGCTKLANIGGGVIPVPIQQLQKINVLRDEAKPTRLFVTAVLPVQERIIVLWEGQLKLRALYAMPPA